MKFAFKKSRRVLKNGVFSAGIDKILISVTGPKNNQRTKAVTFTDDSKN